MKIAVITFRLHAPWVHSLKEKRMIVKSLIARLQNKFHVSAAEVDEQDTPYETEEGCLSLDGVRKTTRYQNIEVEYLDSGWKKHRDKFSGWTAQIIQHEIAHCEGVLI